MTEAAAWKRRDAALYGELPRRYTRYVERLGAHVVSELVRLAAPRPGERVLDVGSGTGCASVAFARVVTPGGHVLGVDHSRPCVERAATLAPPALALEYRAMDAEALELPAASFDVVTCFSALFHFPRPERALAEMRRVLAPGGRLVLSWHAHDRTPAARRPPPGALVAPGCLESLCARHLPELAEPAVAPWSTTGGAERLRSALGTSGLRVERESWVGRDVVWHDPAEFFEVQAMVSSELRARMSAAEPSAREALRSEFCRLAGRAQAAGGQLLYPFGAVCLRAQPL